VRWETFTTFTANVFRETVSQISSASPEFRRRYEKHFGLFFWTRCICNNFTVTHNLQSSLQWLEKRWKLPALLEKSRKTALCSLYEHELRLLISYQQWKQTWDCGRKNYTTVLQWGDDCC